MDDEYVLLTCSINGKIKIGANNMPTYEGGIVKPLMIAKSSNFNNLVNAIYQVSEIDQNQFRIKLVCNWPLSERRTTAVQINSDRDTMVLIKLCEKQVSVELFVEKESLTTGQGEFSRMLDLENDSTGFASPTPCVPCVVGDVNIEGMSPHQGFFGSSS
jgi:hypothetical protein